ncbi:MAG: 3-oxoacyl-[acyl-carrier-protein] reductase [Candidatus Krumholzibacteriia bacterium]
MANRTALITGASRGIGLAIAARLAADGWNLALVARDEARLREAAATLPAGTRVGTWACDVADAEQVARVVAAAAAEFAGIQALINNAGVTADALIVRMSTAQWQKVLDVNLTGTFNFTKAVAPLMMRQRQGRIVNITSVIGLSGNAGQANYAASKAGIIALTKSVARELAGRQVTANAVAPGFISTDMTAGLNEQIRAEMLRSIPLKRFGEGADVAGVVAFLLSPDAAYVTGQTIVCDGGMTM